MKTQDKSPGEAVHHTKNEKMLKLREEPLAIEKDRLAGRMGCTPDELNSYLETVIDEVESLNPIP